MIQFKDFQFYYRKHQQMFDGLNLTLEKGHIYGLLGKNGAGKSTLLKNAVGTLYPKGGCCEVNGVLSASRKASTLAEIFFLPEQISAPEVNIDHFIKMNAPFYPKFSRELFDKVMNEFDLKTQNKLHQLSHGQQKKVFLAFGIATQTDWLLMDEPTNGLDIPSKTAFRKVVTSFIADDRGIVISTHQIADIEKLIDSIVVIDEGKLLLNKSLYEISEKLSFKLVNQPSESDQPTLYEEHYGIGSRVIEENKTGEESLVDLEILFNAVTSKNNQITNILNE
jgi:ABC-2 type transport system ATP-binding protein